MDVMILKYGAGETIAGSVLATVLLSIPLGSRLVHREHEPASPALSHV